MEMDFTGINPRNPLVTYKPQPGPHKGKIVSVTPNYNNGKSTQFAIDLTEGPSAGMTITKNIGNEPGEKGGNKAQWLQALCSIAPNPDAFLTQARQGMKFTPETNAVATFTGKMVAVYIIENPGQTPDPQTGIMRDNLPNIEFLTAAQYAQVVAAQKSTAGHAHAPAAQPGAVAFPGAAAPAAPAAATPPNGAPAAPAPGGDVLAGLFGGAQAQ